MHAQGQSEAGHLHLDAGMHAAVQPGSVLGLQGVAALGLEPGATMHAAVEDAAGLAVAPAGWQSCSSAVPDGYGEQSYGFSLEHGVHQATKQAGQQLGQAHCVHT